LAAALFRVRASAAAPCATALAPQCGFGRGRGGQRGCRLGVQGGGAGSGCGDLPGGDAAAA
jgi:hypothetical protein